MRIGHGTGRQFQSDMYGLLMELAWRWSELGNRPDGQDWDFLVDIVEAAATQWTKPDQGIWEVRSAPRHFVHSKAMCWVAVRCGMRRSGSCWATFPRASRTWPACRPRWHWTNARGP